jgi:uncharacterized ferredoxin-like protein
MWTKHVFLVVLLGEATKVSNIVCTESHIIYNWGIVCNLCNCWEHLYITDQYDDINCVIK